MHHRPHVLIAEDDDEVRAWIADTLDRAGFLVTAVASGADALAHLERHAMDLMVLDLDMPGGGGMSVLARAGAEVPAVIVSGHADLEHRVAALDAGAVDFVAKPLDSRELIARVRAHLRVSALAAAWREGAVRDALTGLLNRRGVLTRLERAVDQIGAGGPLAVMFIDLDHFKQVNDRHGHLAGDRMLRRVGGILAEVAGPGAVAGRWGGDEFVIAVTAADPLRVAQIAVELGDALARQLGPSVSASIGTAWLRAHDVGDHAARGAPDDPPSRSALPLILIEAADRAMYRDRLARAHRAPGRDAPESEAR